MVYCSYCSTANRAGSRFCNQCGRTLPGPNLFCSRCQALITEVDRFCHNCGARLTDASRHFGSFSLPQANDPLGTVAPGSDAMASGTFVEATDLVDEPPQPTATPTAPLRTVGSWHLIDNWVAKQIKRGVPVESASTAQDHTSRQTWSTPRDVDHGMTIRVGQKKKRFESDRGSPQAPTLRIGIRVDSHGRLSRHQTVGMLALLLAAALLVFWLLGTRR